jgi:hypothetical protein
LDFAPQITIIKLGVKGAVMNSNETERSESIVAGVMSLSMLIAAAMLPALIVQERVLAQEIAIPAIAKHQGWVTFVQFTPDGKQLLTVGGESLQFRPGQVNLWNAENGDLIQSFEGHKTNVWSASFSRDGKQLVTASYDGKVLVWDVEKKSLVKTLDKHSRWCRSVVHTPDSSKFATASEDGSVIVWDAETLEVVKTLKLHDSAIYQIAISRDGSLLATASVDKTSKLVAWTPTKRSQRLIMTTRFGASLSLQKTTFWPRPERARRFGFGTIPGKSKVLLVAPRIG